MTIEKFVDHVSSWCAIIALLVYFALYPIFTLISYNSSKVVSMVSAFFIGVALLFQAIFAKTEALRMLWITSGIAFWVLPMFFEIDVWLFAILLVLTFMILKAFTDYLDYTVETYHKIKRELKE